MTGIATKVSLCQSCGRPLTRLFDFGTAHEAWRNDEYCRYCYPSGAFTSPRRSLLEMNDWRDRYGQGARHVKVRYQSLDMNPRGP